MNTQNAFLQQNMTPKVYARQIAFIGAFLLPASKLLEVPSLLAKYAKGDLLFPAILHYLLQSLVLLAVLFVASRSEKSIWERLESALGKGVYFLCFLYALYFLFAAVLPVLDMEKFVYAAFFDTAPTTFSFAFFFFFSAYACAKGLQSVSRCADLCLFLFPLPFLALICISFSTADFSTLLPLFGTDFTEVSRAFLRTTPHFSDTVLLLPLLVHLKYQRGDGVKILSGYGVGALFSLLFFAVFFGIYSSIAPREHYAFSKIGQYFPALSVLGRVDLLFVYLLSVVLLFFTALPLQYSIHFISFLFPKQKKTYLSAVFNLFLFFGVLFLNKYYDTFYRIISGSLFFVFMFIADMVPPFLFFLQKTPKNKDGGKHRV